MTTTSPDWYPVWPAGFPDVQGSYEATVPQQYPQGLYYEDSGEHQDQQAQGVVFSWIAQGSTWIRRRFFPQYDVEAQFLPYWEDALALIAAATVTLRQNNIYAALRHMRKTATKNVVQTIFAPIFGQDDPARVAFSVPQDDQILAAAPDTEQQWARLTNTMHIHDADETAVPDRSAGLDAIEKTRPTYQHWTIGQYQGTKYDTQGGYDISCYV